MWDDKTFTGVTVGRGAQIVNGCVNNPMALMCEQVGSLLWSCIIITEKLLLEAGCGWVGKGGGVSFHGTIKTLLCILSKLCAAVLSLGTDGDREGLQNGFRHTV